MDIGSLSSIATMAGAVPQKKSESSPSADTFQHVLAQASSETGKLAGAAKQFEAMIAGQVLKAAREASNGGWLGSDDDETGELAIEMAEQGFAQALAAKGGLGVAKIVTNSLQHTQSTAANSAPADLH